MTDRITALRALLEKVEAGDDAGFRRANRAVFSTPCQDMDLQLREEHCRHAYKGSLDAAKALHEAVLPGWNWSAVPSGGNTRVGVWNKGAGPDYRQADSTHNSPARSWLCAILRALISMEEEG